MGYARPRLRSGISTGGSQPGKEIMELKIIKDKIQLKLVPGYDRGSAGETVLISIASLNSTEIETLRAMKNEQLQKLYDTNNRLEETWQILKNVSTINHILDMYTNIEACQTCPRQRTEKGVLYDPQCRRIFSSSEPDNSAQRKGQPD